MSSLGRFKHQIDYDEAVRLVAEWIADDRDEDYAVKHHNEAKRILWPCLDERAMAERVMR